MITTQKQMYKIAWTPASLTSVGNLLSKKMPKFFEGVKGVGKAVGLTAANANKAGVVGGVMGGVGGAASGATDQNPETQGRSMLVRGAIGAAAGFYGGKGLAKKMPTFGDNYATTGKLVGGKMLNLAKDTSLTAAQRSDKLTEFAAKNLTTQTKTMGKSQTTKNFFGHGAEVSSNQRVTNPKVPMGFKMFGDLAKAKTNVRKSGLVRGTIDTIKDNYHESTMFDKAISDKPNAPVYRFKRSLAGRVVNPLMTSGIGMGALDVLQTTNEDGSKATMGKRLRTGAKSTLTWGMAPHLMMGKAMAYDIPKAFMGGSN